MSIRLILEIIAALALAGGVWWYTDHERSQGAQQCLADDAKAVAKQAAKDAQILTDKLAEVKRETETYHEQTNTVVTAPVVRVCVARSRTDVQKTTATGPIGNEKTDLRTGDEELPTVIDWPTQPIVQISHNADAQVTALEDYINNVCLK